MKVVGIRGLDEELYKKVKAAAALRGMRVRDAFEEALRLWLSVKPEVLGLLGEVEVEAEANRRAFRELREKLLGGHAGSYVAVARGRLVGVFDTFDEAAEAVERLGVKQAVIERLVEEPGRRRVELGW
ncbi:MAG: hypothetical protein ABWK01_06860, partial [Infirmifilum sp.]